MLRFRWTILIFLEATGEIGGEEGFAGLAGWGELGELGELGEDGRRSSGKLTVLN
jgi:hypothetical protein